MRFVPRRLVLSLKTHEPYTVVIPVRNGLKYLCGAINSVLVQTAQPSEIIVVDDHSDDGLLDTDIKQWISSGVNVRLVPSYGYGVSAARNTGISLANTNCIALLDVDDLWLPNKMEKQLSIYTSSRFVHTGYYLVKDNLDIIGIRNPEKTATTESIYSQEYLVTGSASAAVFSKSSFTEAGFFDESLFIGEDLDLWIRLSSILEFVSIYEPLVKIRRHEESVQSLGNDTSYLFNELQSLLRIWNKNNHLCPNARIPINNVMGSYFASTKFSPISFMKLVSNRKFMNEYRLCANSSKFDPFLTYLFRLKNILIYKFILQVRKSKAFRGIHKLILILAGKI